MKSSHEPRDLHDLFEALLEGTLTTAQAHELDALLIRDPQVRRRYVEFVQLHASLDDHVAQLPLARRGAEESAAAIIPAASSGSAAVILGANGHLAPGATGESNGQAYHVPTSRPIAPAPLPASGFFHSLPLLIFTLLVFVGGAALGLYYRHSHLGAIASTSETGDAATTQAPLSSVTTGTKQNSAPKQATPLATATENVPNGALPFATLVKVNGCKWGACTLPTQTGSRLSAGLLRLDSGKAQITFDNGARLYLQGPAVFYLYSPSRTHLQSGKLVANVPEQAIGFTIETQKAEIVDLGTEFGLSVGSTGDTEVHVLDGEVEVGAAAAPVAPQERLQSPESSDGESLASVRQRLLVGDARRIESGAEDWRHVDFTPDLYHQLRPTLRRTPESPWRNLLTDDFDDNHLDADKWRVAAELVPSGTPQIREIDGRLVLVDRGRLVTAHQLDPVRLEGLRITGQWTFKTPDDIFDVVLRTDGVPTSDGSVAEGIHFRARMERTTSHIGVFGTGWANDLPPAFGDILINPGDVFNFEILDVPGGLSLRMWEASGSGAEAHVHTVAPAPAETNFVVFHNRNRGKSAYEAYLDNLVIEQGSGNVSMNRDGLIEVRK